jgi:S-adenosylmethionine/arginine decarboxylase-like enzyme
MAHVTCGRNLLITGITNSDGHPLLKDHEYLEQLLDEIAESIGSRVLVRASMISIEDTITGTAILSTSHISIHIWPEQKRFTLDLYSCEDYDPEVPIEIVKSKLKMISGEILSFDRYWDTGEANYISYSVSS